MEGFAAIAENLAALEGDERMLYECRSAHLREAAWLVCEGIGLDDLSADFDAFRDRYKIACEKISDKCAFGANDRIILCSHIADILGKSKSRSSLLKKFFSSEDPPKDPVICYLRNPIADLAYTEFTRGKPQAGVLYADSFQSVCENLIGGECDYALLPVVSGSDGRLTRFETMIASYGFAVTALVSVTPNPDITADTFALLSRSIELPQTEKSDKRLCLSFSVPADTAFAELLSAANASGLELISLGTQSSPSRKSFSVTLDITAGNVTAFLAYLALEESGFVANGLFFLNNTEN